MAKQQSSHLKRDPSCPARKPQSSIVFPLVWPDGSHDYRAPCTPPMSQIKGPFRATFHQVILHALKPALCSKLAITSGWFSPKSQSRNVLWSNWKGAPYPISIRSLRSQSRKHLKAQRFKTRLVSLSGGWGNMVSEWSDEDLAVTQITALRQLSHCSHFFQQVMALNLTWVSQAICYLSVGSKYPNYFALETFVLT